MTVFNSRLAALIRCIRWDDVIILEGVPILGLAFSIGAITGPKLVTSGFFLIANFFLLAHTFTLNDWADFTRGIHHSSRGMVQLENRNVTPRLLLVFSGFLFLGAALIFLFLSRRCLLFALLIAALGIFYSHPSLNAKSMPIVSTLLHLAGALLHFLLGYALFSEIDRRGVLIGLLLGLIFAAGHPVQEARDVLEDRQVGAKTNAVAFGKSASFNAGLVLFTVEYVYLFWLALSGLIPRFLIGVPIVCYPIHLCLGILTLRNGLTFETITRFEERYRVLYALIGLSMLLAAIT